MIVMNPFAGVIADKVDKKKLVVCMDVLRVLINNSLYIEQLLWIKLINYLYYYLSYDRIYNVFGIGLEAVKPNMVTKERLMSINSISKIIDSISLILGPMLGALFLQSLI